MANNLLQKGKKLIVYDVVDSAMKQAVSAGARHASSPAEVREYFLHNIINSVIGKPVDNGCIVPL